jgi:hypothetical protein
VSCQRSTKILLHLLTFSCAVSVLSASSVCKVLQSCSTALTSPVSKTITYTFATPFTDLTTPRQHRPSTHVVRPRAQPKHRWRLHASNETSPTEILPPTPRLYRPHRQQPILHDRHPQQAQALARHRPLQHQPRPRQQIRLRERTSHRQPNRRRQIARIQRRHWSQLAACRRAHYQDCRVRVSSPRG